HGVDGLDVALGDGLDLENGTDGQLRRRAEVAGLTRILPGHREDDVAALNHHRGAGYAESVDAVTDDLLGQAEVLLVRFPDRDERDPGPALQVDPELGRQAPVGDGEGAEEDDEKEQEES